MKTTFLQVFLLSLATFRIALMISKESGPFWMFKHLRRGVKRNAPQKTHMDEGIECLWCMSMQVGIIIAVSACFFLGNPVYDVCILALAVSAIAVILNQMFTR